MSVSSLDRLLNPLRRKNSRRRQRTTMSPPPSPLATLLKERDFEMIYNILNDSSMDMEPWFEGEYSTLGENCLHVTMKTRPPASLIELMLNRLIEYGISEPELSVDELGRTPLHHAVGYSCSPAVIDCLVSGPAGRTSVRAQDVEGRLPLHLAMRPYLLYTGADRKIHPTSNLQLHEARRIMRATVAILVNVCPKSVTVADDMNRRPINYAETLRLDKNFGNCARHIIDELRTAENESRTGKKGTPTSSRHRGMVIDISSVTSKTDEDDLSVLSWE